MAVVQCYRSLGDFNSMPIPGLASEFDDPWTVITDSINDNAATIYAAGLLPSQWASFPDNIFATCRRISLHREKQAPLIWRALAHYSSAPLTQDEEQKALFTNPCSRLSEIDWEATPYQVPVFCSIDGKVIINSAGDTPDQVVERTDFYWVATVVKNVEQIPFWAIDYCGKVNAAPFVIDGLSVEAESARLVQMRLSRKQKEGTQTYRQLTLGLEFRGRRILKTPYTANQGVWPPDFQLVGQDSAYPVSYDFAAYSPPPFYVELPDIGLHETLSYPGGNKTRIMTNDTPPKFVGQPVPLNGLGVKLASPSMTNQRFLAYNILDTRDFSRLPLA
jgi:hypothetical protein